MSCLDVMQRCPDISVVWRRVGHFKPHISEREGYYLPLCPIEIVYIKIFLAFEIREHFLARHQAIFLYL